MLVKVNHIYETENKVNVTLLDIDELGSVVPMKELELNIIPYDDSIINILKSSSHVIIFSENINDNPTIISAINLTDDELNHEKEKIINAAAKNDRNSKTV